MIYLYTAPAWLPLLMLALYAVGIQYQRPCFNGTYTGIFLEGVAFVALILDVALNWTLFALYFWDWPQRSLNEWTLSTRLSRLKRETGLRGSIARAVTFVLDWLSPTGKHVND
jgi:hypothetical protein